MAGCDTGAEAVVIFNKPATHVHRVSVTKGPMKPNNLHICIYNEYREGEEEPNLTRLSPDGPTFVSNSGTRGETAGKDAASEVTEGCSKKLKRSYTQIHPALQQIPTHSTLELCL